MKGESYKPSGPLVSRLPESKGSWTKGIWRAVVLFALAILVMLFAWRLHLTDKLPLLRAWVSSLGALGPLLFLAVNVVSVAVALPAAPFTLMAGAMFGVTLGVPLALAGAIGGASLGFVLARTVARDAVKEWVARHPALQRLESGSEKYDAVLVAGTRLLPIFPFNLVNYAWGLTRISFRTYVVWSTVGKFPQLVLFVAGAAAAAQGLTTRQTPWGLFILMGGMVLVIACATVWVRNRMLGEERRAPDSPRDGSVVRPLDHDPE